MARHLAGIHVKRNAQHGDKYVTLCEKKGHVQAVCNLRIRQRQDGVSPATKTTGVGAMVTPNMGMFSTLSSIPGIQQSPSSEWLLDHVEWTEEGGWLKTHPKAMPKVPLDIEVMTRRASCLTSPIAP